MSAHLGDLGFSEFCLSIHFKCELDFLIPEAGLSKPWHCLWFYISSQFLNVANFYVCFIQLPPGDYLAMGQLHTACWSGTAETHIWVACAM